MIVGKKPRCALRVGVVGNRRFGDSDNERSDAAERMKEHASAALDQAWEAVVSGISSALEYEVPCRRSDSALRMRDLFSNELPRLAVISSLAAGSDQIGAQSALAVARDHAEISIELEAILPFGEEEYPGLPKARRPQFRQEEAELFRSLAAHASQIVRLSGDFHTTEGRREGYVQARDLLLQNCDVLIAVYKADASLQVAGAVESVRRAQQQNMPVIAILVGEHEARIRIVQPPIFVDANPVVEWETAHTLSEGEWREALLSCILEQLVLPEALRRERSNSSPDAETKLDCALHRVALMSGARTPTLCANPIAAAIFGTTWTFLQHIARWNAHPRFVDRLALPSASSTEHGVQLQPYADAYHRASALAIAFMRTYRGAFVTSFALAVLAVMAAVSMMTIALLSGGNSSHPHMWLLCFAKIGILTGMLWLERVAHRGKFQEAGADFRYLAELLRPMQWLTPVATYPTAIDPLRAARHDSRLSWMAWLARAIARSSPCIAVRENGEAPYPKEICITADDAAIALERAGKEWVQRQILYHSDAAARMHILADGLERLGKRLVVTVLVAAVVGCAIELENESSRALHATAVSLEALAAFLPAWVAALAGISFQSEAKRLAMRSDEMLTTLTLMQKELVSASKQIRSGKVGDRTLSYVTTLLRNTAAMTIGEAADWKVLYQVHEVHAG